jgi:hypothetical protein
MDCAAISRDLFCTNSTNKNATKFVSRSLSYVTFSADRKCSVYSSYRLRGISV